MNRDRLIHLRDWLRDPVGLPVGHVADFYLWLAVPGTYNKRTEQVRECGTTGCAFGSYYFANKQRFTKILWIDDSGCIQDRQNKFFGSLEILAGYYGISVVSTERLFMPRFYRPGQRRPGNVFRVVANRIDELLDGKSLLHYPTDPEFID